jgi:hypothetical protein
MGFKLSSGRIEREGEGRLYLLWIQLKSGLKVVKFGKSSGSSSVDRMMQIQRDYFMKNRWTFICNLKRDRAVDNVFQYEHELHEFFKEYQFKPKIPFDGSTEIFIVNWDAAVDVYEYLLENGLGSLEGIEFNPDAYIEEDLGEIPF